MSDYYDVPVSPGTTNYTIYSQPAWIIIYYQFATSELSDRDLIIIDDLYPSQAYRGLRTHHLRVSLTFPQRFSP